MPKTSLGVEETTRRCWLVVSTCFNLFQPENIKKSHSPEAAVASGSQRSLLPRRIGFAAASRLHDFTRVYQNSPAKYPLVKLTWLLKMAHLQLIYMLKIVIFHSYVGLLEGRCYIDLKSM